ncbi:hypothetical protein BC629DRAFT_1473506, partial [Irpex lacteus]
TAYKRKLLHLLDFTRYNAVAAGYELYSRYGFTHIWSARWTFVKVLYLWTRYAPIADTFLGFVSHFTFMNPQGCKLNDSVNSFLVAAGMYSSELVLVWRTLALWQDSKPVRYSLVALWALMFPMGIYSITAFVISTVYAPQPFANQPGCNLVDASSIIAGDFVGLTVLELVIVILTAVKGIYHMRKIPRLTGVHYVRILYRDGVLFFICLALLSVGNVLAPFLGPKSNALLLPTFLRTMHSTLCCRVILNLRRAAAEEENQKELELPRSVKGPFGQPHIGRKMSSLRFNVSKTLRTLTSQETGNSYVRMDSPVQEEFASGDVDRRAEGGEDGYGVSSSRRMREEKTIVEGEEMV